ncbi:30S ribosomal protein S17 [Candidatus Daviesbacteria bacterium]|nr:30S ribosomal protein S17 [Candidatus Daviesbacteria bacterium]
MVVSKDQKIKKVKKEIKEPKVKETKVVEEKPILKAVQVMRGLVIAAKSPKTVVVSVERRKVHPLYGKSFIRSKKYLVHDEVGVKAGDVVEIKPCRPISKNKHFAVVKVVGKKIETLIEAELKERAAEEIAEILPQEPQEIENEKEKA